MDEVEDCFSRQFPWHFESFKRKDNWTSFSFFFSLQSTSGWWLFIPSYRPSFHQINKTHLPNTHRQHSHHPQSLTRNVSSTLLRNSVLIFLYTGKPSCKEAFLAFSLPGVQPSCPAILDRDWKVLSHLFFFQNYPLALSFGSFLFSFKYN